MEYFKMPDFDIRLSKDNSSIWFYVDGNPVHQVMSGDWLIPKESFNVSPSMIMKVIERNIKVR